jgi:segregation and condensation protein A
MAAELAHIKSKMLLPPKEGVPVEAGEEAEDVDPRGELVRRLLEYQKYRDAAHELSDRDQLGRDVFSRQGTSELAVEDFDPGLRDLSIFRLVEAMADVLAKLEPEAQHEVIADSVTIGERVRFILDFTDRHGERVPFVELFNGIESRRVVVMTFLAILELARTGVLRIEQHAEAAEPPSEPPAAPAVEQPAPSDDAEAPPRVRHVAELPPLRAPAPGEIVLVMTGKKPVESGPAADDYR